MVGRVRAALCAAVLVVAGTVALVAATPAAATGVASVPRPDHVVIVIDENHAEQNIIGNPAAPYINSLAGSSANMTKSFAETHPSQPNYLALFSGSTQGVTDDGCPHTFTGDNLGSELLAAGDTFAGYSETLPSVGFTGCQSGLYARKHNPWVNFSNIPAASNQPFTAFPTDYSTLPDVSFVIPNLNGDMHDGTIAQGDSWLQNNLSGYITWAQTHNSLFILTFDEDDGSEANQIPTIITGGGVSAGAYAEQINHYNLLRTLEDAYGLAPVGASATANPILDIWTPVSGDQPPVAAFTPTCTGLSCSFDASASTDPDGTIASYAWNFGDGASDSGVTPAVHTFPAAGTYQVALLVTDEHGATDSVTHAVTVSAGGGPTPLLSDAFGRTVTNGWGSADIGGAWSQIGSAALFSVSGGAGHMLLNTPNASPTATATTVSATNVNLVVDVAVDKIATGNGVAAVIMVHHTTTSDYRLRLRLLPAGVVHLVWSRVVAGKETTVQEVLVNGVTYTPNTPLRLRVQALTANATTTITGKVWTATNPEPATWQITGTDTTAALQTPGTIAIQSGLGSTTTNAPTTVTYDNLTVTNPTGVSQPPVAAFTPTCSQLTCTFDASASTASSGPISGYAWDFGDGATGSGRTATHAFISAGSYQVTLTVTDSLGATGTTKQTVTATAPPVNHPPVAAFTWTCTGLSCTFDGSSSSDPDDITPDQWSWNFGDGASDSGVTPAAHTFPAAGTYQVALLVTDEDDATDSVTHAVTVTAPVDLPPVAAFSPSTSYLVGSFDASGSSDPDGSVAGYAWDFGDGSTGSGKAVTHPYAQGGTYTVTLTVTDNQGVTTSVQHAVTVAPNQAPSASFTNSCNGGSCTFNAGASKDPDGTIVSYGWSFGDGGSGSGVTPVHNYTATGTYQVTLTTTDDQGATGTAQVQVAVTVPTNQAPTAVATEVCTNLACTFDGSTSTDSDGTVASYAWSFGDGATATGAKPVHTYAKAGTYAVGLTVTDNQGASGTTSQNLTVVGTTLYAADTFARTLTNAWGSADTGGAYSLTGSASMFSVASGSGVMKMSTVGSCPTAMLNSVSATNINQLLDITTDAQGTGNGISVVTVARHTSAGDYRMKLRLLPGGVVHLALSRVVNGTETVMKEVVVSGLTYNTGDQLRLRFVVSGDGTTTTLTGKTWNAAATEPATAQLTMTDTTSTLQGAGSVGVQSCIASNTTNAPVTARFANYTVNGL